MTVGPVSEAPEARCAVVALAGRPNVGKSTLVNAMVGEKVAIVSHKPQTTRRSLRGVVTGPAWQLVLTDLPGVQRPRDPMTKRMQKTVDRGLADADVVLFVVDGATGIGPGDRFIAHALTASGKDPGPQVVVAVNKVDRLSRAECAAALADTGALAETGLEIAEIFPVSARTGAGIGPLAETLAGLAPPGPFLFPEEQRADLFEQLQVGELIREQILERTRQELPHATEVIVDEIEQKEELTVVRARIWVESDSQKAIVIGHGGQMVREIGTAARRELERHFGRHVHLDLRVKVEKDWRKRGNLLDRLGI